MCSTNAQGCASWKENTLHCSLIIVQQWTSPAVQGLPKILSFPCHLLMYYLVFKLVTSAFSTDSLWFQYSRYIHKLTKCWKFYAVDTSIAVVVCWEISYSSGQDCIENFGKPYMGVVMMKIFKFHKRKLSFVQDVSHICIIMVITMLITFALNAASFNTVGLGASPHS